MTNDGQSTPEARGVGGVTAPGNGIVVHDAEGLPERSVTTLVGGIIADAQHLIGQQLTMFRQEIRDDLRKSRDAALALAAGVGVALMGVVLVLIMLPLLLRWEVPELPLWACFGIVGGILAAFGGVLAYAGVKKFESFNPLSDQSFKALKENLKWTTSPK
jgi:Putative Actinobacterial Holin-X, holin superfamily III